MIRTVVATDLPAIRTHLAALSFPPYYPSDEGLLAETLAQVALYDDTNNMVCRIDRSVETTSLTVLWLLPRSAWADPPNLPKLATLLSKTLTAALARWPDAAAWVIVARFQDGRDAAGNPDGGEALCKAWRDAFGPGPRPTVAQLGSGEWQISWGLQQAEAKLRQVLGL